MAITHVSDSRSNSGDQLVFAANQINRSEHKKMVFEAVYFGKKKVKTVEDISKRTKLSRKRVLEEAIKLVTAKLIHKANHPTDTAYEKDETYQGNWKKVLKLAGNKTAINKVPTKVNPKGNAQTVTLRVPKNKAQIRQITVDDFDNFKKVKGVKVIDNSKSKIPETQFKKGILKILNDKQNPKDWGGEKNDIFTTRTILGGKRIHSVFALKGPGQKVTKLTPKHMGKNGDQIQRLADSSAEAFIVQYWGEIDQSIVDQLQQYAIAKSYLQNRRIYFGVIDGVDSSRLITAYPNAFK